MAKIAPPAAPPQAPFKIRNPEGIGVLYVRQYTGRAWLVTHVGNRRHQATGIPWPDDDGTKRNRLGITQRQQVAVNRGLAILQQRVLEYRHPELRQEPTEAPTRLMLSAAIEEFNHAKGVHSKSKAIQSRYRNAVEHLLIGSKGDLVLESTTLRKRIITLKEEAEAKVNINYLKKLMYKVREMCEYWEQCGYVERNPINAIGIPNQVHEDDVQPMEQETFRRIVELATRQHHHTFVEYLMLMLGMGLRASEAVGLTWDDWNGQTLRVHGKRVRGNRTGVRFYAVFDTHGRATTPGLPGTLWPLEETLDRIRQRTGGKGKFFPEKTIANYQRMLLHLREELDLPPHNTLRSLRSGAVLIMRDVYKWGVEFRCLQLGHSVAVHIRHYEKRRRRSEESAEAAVTYHI